LSVRCAVPGGVKTMLRRDFQVGKVAESAGVSTLVLNHIIPGNARA
jgi:hypothetical protein